MKFLARMLQAFLLRHKPASTIANPAFIQKTRNAVSNVQTVSRATFNSPASCDQLTPGARRMRKANEQKSQRLFFMTFMRFIDELLVEDVR